MTHTDWSEQFDAPAPQAAATQAAPADVLNPFLQHGIQHLSNSHLNSFIDDRGMWALNYLAGKRTPANVNMIRGTTAELGVEFGLKHPDKPVEDAIAYALEAFDKQTALIANQLGKQKAREEMPGFVGNALQALKPLGEPEFLDPESGRQHRIELNLDGIAVPVIGYLDFFYPNQGLIVDLKTTARMPTTDKKTGKLKMSDAHSRQGAIYSAAHGNMGVKFLYVTPKKSGFADLEDAQHHLQMVGHIAARLQAYLELTTDTTKLIEASCPNFDGWKWNDPQAVLLRQEVFGI